MFHLSPTCCWWSGQSWPYATTQTLKALAKWRPNPMMERLLTDSEETTPRDDTAALIAFRDRLIELRARAERWTLARSGTETLEAGVRRTYRSACSRMTKARETRAPNRFHDWRKSNKNYGFAIDLLRKAASETLSGELDVIDELSTTLGQHHDLVVLRMAPMQGQLPLHGSEEPLMLNALIDERLVELEREAFDLGRQVYAERPAALTRRIMAYWKSASP